MVPHPTCKSRPPAVPWRIAAAALSAFLLASCGGGGGGGGQGDGPIDIRTVNNRADLVSDGDALVEIKGPPGQIEQGVSVKLNGTDVSSSFVDQGGGRLLGLVSGLKTGDNVLLVSPKTARDIDYADSDREGLVNERRTILVDLKYRGRTLRVPIWVIPGHADGAAPGEHYAGRR